MNCNELRERMSAYLERDLPAGERTALERHLDTCAACQREIGLFRRTLRSLKNLPPAPSVPSWFEQELHARIRTRGRRRTTRRIVAGVGLAAGVLLAFLLGVWVGQGPAPAQQASREEGIPLSPAARRDFERDGFVLAEAGSPGAAGRPLLIADPTLYQIHPRYVAAPALEPAHRLPGEPMMAGEGSPEMVIEARPASAEARPPGQEVTLLPVVVKQSF